MSYNYYLFEMNSKFYVIYDNSDEVRPSIHQFHEIALQRQRKNSKLQIKTFSNEINAEKFLYLVKIRYLEAENGLSKSSKGKSYERMFNADIQQDQDNQDIKKLIEQIPDFERKRKEQQENKQKLEEKKQKLEENQINVFSKMNKQVQLKARNVFSQILKHQQSNNSFIKSKPLLHINSQTLYQGFFDGCCKGNPGESGIGYYVQDHQRNVVFQQGLYIGTQTNNGSQFYALIHLLLECIYHKIKKIKIFGDSQFVVKGVRGQYKIKKPNVVQKNKFAQELVKFFQTFEIEHIRRNYNEKADYLCNQGLRRGNIQKFKKMI